MKAVHKVIGKFNNQEVQKYTPDLTHINTGESCLDYMDLTFLSVLLT